MRQEIFGRRPPAVSARNTSRYSKEAEGIRLVGAQFRVGTLRQSGTAKFTLMMGEQAIWSSASGWTKTAEDILFGKRGFGSMRKKDC